MKGLQRIISGILTVCLLISMLPMGVWATETKTEVESIPEATVFETQESTVEVTEEATSVPVETDDVPGAATTEATEETVTEETVTEETVTDETVTEETVTEETVTEETGTPETMPEENLPVTAMLFGNLGTISFEKTELEVESGGTVAITAVYVSEEAPDSIEWNCDTLGAVQFSSTSVMNPTMTQKENTWWLSVVVTGVTVGSHKITLTIDNLTSRKINIHVTEETTARYTVLILDGSGSMRGTPTTEQKEAAINFCRSVLSSAGRNYIAVVELNSSASQECSFTDQEELLVNCINKIPADGGTNTNHALQIAGTLLDSVTDSGKKIYKNIVLCSDGLPQSGSTTSSGPYTSSDYGDYKYANYCYNTAAGLKAKGYTIYSLGFFHSLTGDKLTFGRRLMSDIATEDCYHEVINAEDLEFTFDEIADEITVEPVSIVLNHEKIAMDHRAAVYRIDAAVINNSKTTPLTNVFVNIDEWDNAEITEGEWQQDAAALDAEASATFSWTISIDRIAYPDGGSYTFRVYAGSDQTVTTSVQGSIALEAVNGVSNKLDFSKDVWKFENFEDSPHPITEEDKNALLQGLAPNDRAAILKKLAAGSGGHCYGMSASVILDKMNVVDFSEFTDTANLRDAKKNDRVHSILCYYQVLQYLRSVNSYNQAYFEKEEAVKLADLSEMADAVNYGGSPVLIGFQTKIGEGENAESYGHATVAYAVESGEFPSHKSGRTYNRRILIYDCNANKNRGSWKPESVEFSDDYCILYNEGTAEWEIPYYVDSWHAIMPSLDAQSEAKFIVCTNDLNIIDAHNYDAGLYNYAAELICLSETALRMENTQTGNRWIISEGGTSVQGDTKLTTYSALEDSASQGHPTMHIVLPDETAEYSIATVSGAPEQVDFNILFDDRYVSVASNSAGGAKFSDTGDLVLVDNTDVFELVVADNNIPSGEFNTYTITGDAEGDITVSVTENGITVRGDDLNGVTIEASDGKKSDTITIEGETGFVEVGRDGDDLVQEHIHSFKDNICQGCGLIGGVCGDDLTWTLSRTTGRLAISGTGAMYDFEREESPWYVYRNQIREIILPDGLTCVGDESFRGLSKVKYISIPGTVTEIGSCAFIGTGLASVSLPEGLLVIGSSAFSYTQLESVDIPDSATSIEDWAFHYGALESLHIPANVAEIGGGAFAENPRLQTITVDSKNANFVADASGVLYSKDMTTLYQCPGGFTGEYVIPAGVTTLECSAFSDCRGLTKITIPDSVVNVLRQSHFADCTGLTELILPDGITRLPYAFAFGANNLTKVKLPEQLTHLGNNVFSGCSSLTRIIIPENVAKIGDYCFDTTSLTSVIFRGNAPTIEDNAFYGLTVTAYYPGNDTTWTADTMRDYGGTITWIPYYGVENVARIDAKKVVLEAGESINLKAILDPGKTAANDIIWTLSNEGDGTTLTSNGADAILTAGWYIHGTVITVTAQTVTGDAEPAVLEIMIKERPADYTLFSGKSMTLKEPGYSSKQLTWSTYDDYAPYVTLTSAGRLTAKKVVSKTRILIFCDVDGRPGFMRIVDILPTVTHVEIRNKEGDVVNDKTVPVSVIAGAQTFTATAHPLDTLQNVTWSISDAKKQDFGKYEINGNTLTVTNLNNGKDGTVTVKATIDAGQKKTVTFKLQFGSFAREMKITAANNQMQSGNSLQLSAVTVPAAPTKTGIIWSLSKEDMAYASISSSGLLKAKTVYDATNITVIATSKDGYARAEYPVLILPANSGILMLKCDGKSVTNGTTYVDMNGDPTITLTARRFDGLAQPSITWTVPSSVKILEMTETTLTIRFLKAGTVTIKATGSDGQKATVKVIAAQMAQRLEISQKKTGITEGLEVASGKSLELQATVVNAKNKKVTWSLAPGDEAYATISSSGKLTANKNLTSMRQVTVISTAADGSGVSDDMIVTIRPIAQGVQVYSQSGGQMLFSFRSTNWWVRSNTTLIWDLSHQPDSIAMAAQVYPYYDKDDAMNAMQGVIWKSSAPKIAEFVEDEEGNVSLKIHKTGSVTVTATAADGSNQKVSFKLKIVKTVTELTIGDQTVASGKSLNLAKLLTINPVDATNKKLTWSITAGNAYATISSSGSFKAKKVTKKTIVEVTVSSQDNGARMRFKVTIIP